MGTASKVLLVLVLLGCGGGKDADKGTAIVEKLCACTDEKCISAVSIEYLEWGKTVLEGYKYKRDVPPETARRLEEMSVAIGKCQRDVRSKLGPR